MNRRLKDVREIARDLPPIASIGDEWDTNPFLRGVPNGVVDLRTGILRDGQPSDCITMQTAVAYDATAVCPLWQATVADIFKDDPEILPYVHRAFGYSITGDMREEVFFILTGTGRNGKGTVVNTIVKVLGDYADGLKFASLETKYSSDGGTGATPDMAKLNRKRFVVASEGTGSSLNTALIKQITGRDPMVARFLRENEFRFEPELKLWLTAQNDKRPRVKDDSEGFWSRPHEIRFQQSYRGREDQTLKDRLMGEAPGILTWLVQGCLAWQAAGLGAPASVREAVAEYRRDQEPLSEFYADRCTFDPELDEYSQPLWRAYLSWADGRKLYGHVRLGQRAFLREVAKRCGESRHTRDGSQFSGIAIRAEDERGQDA
jgi:putative DNA primase/helicase